VGSLNDQVSACTDSHRHFPRLGGFDRALRVGDNPAHDARGVRLVENAASSVGGHGRFGSRGEASDHSRRSRMSPSLLFKAGIEFKNDIADVKFSSLRGIPIRILAASALAGLPLMLEAGQ